MAAVSISGVASSVGGASHLYVTVQNPLTNPSPKVQIDREGSSRGYPSAHSTVSGAARGHGLSAPSNGVDLATLGIPGDLNRWFID